MKRLSIILFDGFQVHKVAELVNFRYDKVRALLALLVVEPERAYRREALVGLLWPDLPEDAARTNLRQALASLRDSLGDASAVPPYLDATRESIRWNPDTIANIDVQTFSQLLQACEDHHHRRARDCKECAQRRTEALRLYRGDLLQGFSLPDSGEFEEWLTLHRENLRLQALDAFHALADYHERRGEYDLAETALRRELELEPWDEENHRRLIRLLYLSDRRSQALAQYAVCRNVLSAELGVEPDAATTALYEQIRSNAPAAPVARASMALPAERPHNLPPTITPFFGREQELSQIADAIDRSRARMITLVGQGGIGKTRLALQAATEQLDNFEDGVFFIPLESLSESEAVVFSIAHTLGITLAGEGDPLQRLIQQVMEKELLLVLDNYEHLLPDTSLLEKMTNAVPGVCLLVTSRQRLNTRGEQVIEVGGLALPQPAGLGDGSEPASLALFISGATRARAGFQLKEHDLPSAIEICRMLDGIPLAIELAAAWLSVLTCAELAVEIHRDVNILSGALQGLPERQRSLRAIFDRTWESLKPDEAQLFRRLAVFRAGFDRQAAEEVAGGSLLLLKSLLEKSLIRRNFRQGYEMHELARQYACERLQAAGEGEVSRQRHLDYYVALTEALFPRLQTDEGPALLARLEDDHDNLRAALDWALASGNLRSGLRLANAMFRLWYWHDHAVEALRWMEVLLAAVQASNAQLPVDLIAKATFRAGVFACEVLDWKHAQSWLEEALRLSRESGDRAEQSNALNSLGTVLFEQGDYAGARRMFTESLAIDREFGPQGTASVPLSNLAEIARVQGDLAASQSFLEECLAIDQQAGDSGGVAYDLECLGRLRLEQGDLDGSRSYSLRSLALRQQLGNRDGIAKSLECLALAAMLNGCSAEGGARLYGAAQTLRKAIGVPLPDSNIADHRTFLDRGWQALGVVAFDMALQEGRLLSLEAAIRLAKELQFH